MHANSRAGAAGLMQFMPATGRRFGLGPDGTGFDTRFDPRAVAQASADYLNERMGELNNNIELSLAAYNGGEGRAQRVYNAVRRPQFLGRGGLQPVPRRNQGLRADGDRGGVAVPASRSSTGWNSRRSTRSRPRFRLARSASIYELTICLGNGGTRDGYMRALRNLNPRYEADAWIPANTMLKGTTKVASLYARNCVNGPRADLARTLIAANVESAIIRSPLGGSVAVGDVTPVAGVPTTVATGEPKPAKPKAQQVRDYRVARGDNLGRISRKFDCDMKQLAKANGLKAPGYSVRPGQEIKLQGCRK